MSESYSSGPYPTIRSGGGGSRRPYLDSDGVCERLDRAGECVRSALKEIRGVGAGEYQPAGQHGGQASQDKRVTNAGSGIIRSAATSATSNPDDPHNQGVTMPKTTEELVRLADEIVERAAAIKQYAEEQAAKAQEEKGASAEHP